MIEKTASSRVQSSPRTELAAPECRFCRTSLRRTFLDLGMSPLCQTHIEPDQLNRAEVFYPLRTYVCDSCALVQLEEFVAPSEIFGDYAYFSSYSDSWVTHARQYVATVIDRFGLDGGSFVAEIASNDGYLLQNFVARNISCLGIEPAGNVAAVAVERGVPTEIQFFGLATASKIKKKYGSPDLLLGNNVLAHVPDLNDFVAGMKLLLGSSGVFTMEFPHLMQLIKENQFDTIYHEHFSYFSFFVAERIFASHGLTLFDVEELSTHGGSLRIFGRHGENAAHAVTDRVADIKRRELAAGLDRADGYAGFGERVRETKRKLLRFLIDAKQAGKEVVGYGAPGKGNTLLNYCGIREDFLTYTVDRNPHKQGRYTPGTRIPILDPARIRETKPDYVLILPWNLASEVIDQTSYIREWGGQFVVPIPELRVLP
jgi:C-methyltransferase C-terminal domain/Putative zinc binding domain